MTKFGKSKLLCRKANACVTGMTRICRKSVVEEEGPQLVAKCDNSNSTRLEQFLRGHHLDELPQLWNVLRGDMSFVGPRPERKFFIDKIIEQTDRYQLIYQMRPGLTSEATLLIVRNLKIANGRPLYPIRICRKMIGPLL